MHPARLLTKRLLEKVPPGGDAASRSAVGRAAGLTGVFCNLLLFAAKLLIGVLAASLSVTADAFNNLSDILSAVIAFIGFRIAAKPPDEEHPFGHARFEYISGLAVAGLMLLVGFRFAESSVTKILHPAPVVFSPLTAVILIASVLVKLFLADFYSELAAAIRSTALKATARDSLNDVLTTTAVLFAMLFERITGVLSDGFIGLAVSLLILYSSIRMVGDTVSPLLGEKADPELVKRIGARITGFDARILGIHDLIVHDYGPGRRFATVHVEIDAREDVLQTHELIDDIERAVSQEEQLQLLIHHDPVVTDDPEQNHLRRMIKKLLRQTDEQLKLHDFRIDRRGEETTILFDLVLPSHLRGKEDEIRRHLQQVLDREDQRYSLDITFDAQSFNRYIR